MKKFFIVFCIIFSFNFLAKAEITQDEFDTQIVGTFAIDSHSCLSGNTPDMSKSANGGQNFVYVYRIENTDETNVKLSYLTTESLDGTILSTYENPSTLIPIIDNKSGLVTGIQLLWEGEVIEKYNLESLEQDEYTIARRVTSNDIRKQCAVEDTKLTTFVKR